MVRSPWLAACRGAATEEAIRLQIAQSWGKAGFDLYRRVSMTVKEGRVLVTTSVADLFRAAWTRVSNGDAPRYHDLSERP